MTSGRLRLRLPPGFRSLREPGEFPRTAQIAAAAAPAAATAAAWATAAWAIALTDLRIWLRRPWQVIGTLFVPLSYTLVAVLGSAAVAANPVAVVNADHGPAGAQIAAAIARAQVFRVHNVTAATAQQMYAGNQVAAIITVPADTTAQLNAGRQARVGLTVNNIDSDVADDIRRGTQDALISWYQGRTSPWPVNVSVQEQTMLPPVQLYQYSILPVIILVATVSGILVAGMVAAREFERRTVKGLLLAPVPRAVIVAGKMTAGWLFTCLTSALVLLVGAALGWTRPASPAGWAEALAAITLASLFVAGLGVAIGTWGRRAQPVSISATIIAVELFALSGGLGVIFFEPSWLQAVAQFDPLTYAIHALQGAVFYQSTAGWARDTAVLLASAAAAAAAGTAAMRRGLVR